MWGGSHPGHFLGRRVSVRAQLWPQGQLKAAGQVVPALGRGQPESGRVGPSPNLISHDRGLGRSLNYGLLSSL